MASSYKSTETQQKALYRLEFYKNKNNWKLYKTVRNVRKKPPPSSKSINKINKTYNVGKDFSGLEDHAELLSPHDKAVTDVEPASHLELKPAEDSLDLHLEYQSPAQMRQTAEDWLTLHGFPVRQEKYSDMYDEYGLVHESADFVRGAHTVPHSSEIDLSVAQGNNFPAECSSRSNKSLCVLSVSQLARSIQRHHSALTLLLREQALRDRKSSSSVLHPPTPFEGYPTRGTDPLRTPESVLSRSHRLLFCRRCLHQHQNPCQRLRNEQTLPYKNK